MEKINVAIIGTGFGALVHLPAYTLNAHFNVLGIYGRDFDRTLKIAASNEIKAYKSLNEIEEDSEAVMVSISSIVSDHYDMAKRFLKCKKNILLEKPMTLNSSDSEELAELAERYKVNTAIGYEHIYDPSWQYIRCLIAKKQYGEIRSIQVEYHFTYWNGKNSERRYSWFSQKELGGGMKGGHLSHIIRIIDFITGNRIKQIYGKTYIEVPEHYDEGGNLRKQTADDTVVAVVELDNGVPVYITISAARYESYKKVIIYTDSAKMEVNGPTNIKVYNLDNRLCLDKIPEEYLIKDYGLDFRINSFVKLLDDFFERYYLEKKNSITDFHRGHELQVLLDRVL